MLKISDWNDVGLQLNLDEHDLHMIRKSHSEFSTRKREMFALWLRSDPSPSYQTLARALFRAHENMIATEICTKYGKVFQCIGKYLETAVCNQIMRMILTLILLCHTKFSYAKENLWGYIEAITMS